MDKTYCEWCRGVTFDDQRGNCASCGGPRSSMPSQDTQDQTTQPIPTPFFVHYFVRGPLHGSSTGIREFDDALRSLWVDRQCMPTHLAMTPKGFEEVLKILIDTAPRLMLDPPFASRKGKPMSYLNKFARFSDGMPSMIEMVITDQVADNEFVFLRYSNDLTNGFIQQQKEGNDER